MIKPLVIFFIVILTCSLISCGRSSKKSFKAFFGFYPTKDVKGLNSYSDELGIDASYWLAFTCDDSTIQKIVAKLQLTKDTIATEGLVGGLNTQPKSWWDTSFVFHAKPFSRKEERLFWYLWYDKKTKRAYFLTFDI